MAPNVPVLIFKQRAIIIRLPRRSRLSWRRRVAVGLTEQYHAIWEAFLKLADVPQIPDIDLGSRDPKPEIELTVEYNLPGGTRRLL